MVVEAIETCFTNLKSIVVFLRFISDNLFIKIAFSPIFAVNAEEYWCSILRGTGLID